MYSFQNDYAEGGHPRILTRLVETNLKQQIGYGQDEYSAQAKQAIQNYLKHPEAQIYFVSGGTQANLLVISSILRPHEAVISAASGHINTHETGAIEATGHRVIAIPTLDGKLRPEDLLQVLNEHTLRPHVVKPKMVYISNTTEVGTVYLKEELSAIYNFCKANDLILYMDGARLGQALTARESDLQLFDLPHLSDVFYIGGTKNGALIGEAVVFNYPNLSPDFDYTLKQRGALLSKGRMLGLQFLTLFEDGLFFEVAKHANQMAYKLADALEKRGVKFLSTPASNQLFPIFSKDKIEKLRSKYLFYDWKTVSEEHTAVRLITSWATAESIIDEFISDYDVF